MYISDYLVGAFFGALIMGFLSIAALTAASRYITKQREKDDRG